MNNFFSGITAVMLAIVLNLFILGGVTYIAWSVLSFAGIVAMTPDFVQSVAIGFVCAMVYSLHVSAVEKGVETAIEKAIDKKVGKGNNKQNSVDM